MKLDQTCPQCGTTEAAGAYCTRCLRVTADADLHRPRQAEVARRSGRTLPRRFHGHKSAEAAA